MKIVQILGVVALLSCGLSIRSAVSQRQSSVHSAFTLELTANVKNGHFGGWDFGNAAEKVVVDGSLVEVGIRKINRSAHEIDKIPETAQGLYGYDFEVRDGAGILVRGKPPGDQNGVITGGGPGRVNGSQDMVLEPGEAYTATVNLSLYYDFSKPGTYTIQVSQPASDNGSSVGVRSNAIRVTVLPAS